MRSIILGTLFLLAGMTSAQTAGALPSCAQDCVTKFTSGNEIGSCGNLDAKCICSNADFLSGIACCLASVCSPADQAAAVVYAQQICAVQGVTVPSAVSCTSTITTASVASTPSATSAGFSATTTAASLAATASSSSSASGSPSATGSPSTTTLKNAGIQNAAGVGVGFAGGLAAVLALL